MRARRAESAGVGRGALVGGREAGGASRSIVSGLENEMNEMIA
jgi:hypothetical protein